MTEGLDLRDDDARFCIIAKVPWPDMGDPYVRERMRRDGDWYANQAAMAVVQSSGRIVRHAADYGGDLHFRQFVWPFGRRRSFPGMVVGSVELAGAAEAQTLVFPTYL